MLKTPQLDMALRIATMHGGKLVYMDHGSMRVRVIKDEQVTDKPEDYRIILPVNAEILDRLDDKL